MYSFINIFRHKFLGVAATVTMIIMLPVALFISQQPQSQRGLAEDATIISFSPLSSHALPLATALNEELSLDLMIEPKNNFINKVNISIKYDPKLVRPSNINPIVVNHEFFPEITEGPIYKNGSVEIMLSVGPDATRSISEKTNIMTFNFQPLSPTIENTKITFDSKTEAYTITLENPDGESIPSITVPAYIRIER